MDIDGSRWKWMAMDVNEWTYMKTDGNRCKSMGADRNGWKYGNRWKWKSTRFNESQAALDSFGLHHQHLTAT